MQYSMIDLRSDTVTRPTAAMLAAMQSAPVGDDVFGEDPSILALEQQAAALFGKEAALFCPSGTMCNQIALKVHTQALDEVITHDFSHINQYESTGFALFSGIKLRLTNGAEGKVAADEIASLINPPFDWLAHTRMVWLENTCNKAGGSCYTLAELQNLSAACQQNGLLLHIDGARIFNAIVAQGYTTQDIGKVCDSLNFCLSKGLGCPVGSLMVGSGSVIRQARRVRKVMGGGMRQAGYLAAAGSYALEHHIERLASDHHRAKTLATALQQYPYISTVSTPETNIIMLQIDPKVGATAWVNAMATHHIKTVTFGNNMVRLVTHLDFTDAMLERVLTVLDSLRF